MAIIPPFFMDAVVSLGVNHPGEPNKKLWVGTGFLVGRKETNDPNHSTIYVITNKHVIENQPMLYVRFNHVGNTGVEDLPMPLIHKDGSPLFSLHPNMLVDVVAIQIIPMVIIQNNLSLNYYDLDDHTVTLKKIKKTGINEGSLIYALGFPMNLVHDSIRTPICRLGCISRVADAFSNPTKATQFLVDAHTFPGNSGGPIISRPENIAIQGTPVNSKANLIGILSAYIPYREVLYSRHSGRDRMIQEENSGLTIVHPVDRIKEVVELEWQRNEDKKAKAKSQHPEKPIEKHVTGEIIHDSENKEEN